MYKGKKLKRKKMNVRKKLKTKAEEKSGSVDPRARGGWGGGRRGLIQPELCNPNPPDSIIDPLLSCETRIAQHGTMQGKLAFNKSSCCADRPTCVRCVLRMRVSSAGVAHPGGSAAPTCCSCHGDASTFVSNHSLQTTIPINYFRASRTTAASVFRPEISSTHRRRPEKPDLEHTNVSHTVKHRIA